jgi:putative endonuclease
MERNKYYVYVLRSQKDERLYTGYTSDIEKRLRDHNAGNTKSLRNRRPLKLVYYEEFNTKAEAIARERYFKTPEGGARKKKLIEQASNYFTPMGEITESEDGREKHIGFEVMGNREI